MKKTQFAISLPKPKKLAHIRFLDQGFEGNQLYNTSLIATSYTNVFLTCKIYKLVPS